MNLIDSDVGKIPHTDIQYIDTGVKPRWIECADNEKYWLRIDEALYRDTIWYPPKFNARKLKLRLCDDSILEVDINEDGPSYVTTEEATEFDIDDDVFLEIIKRGDGK